MVGPELVVAVLSLRLTRTGGNCWYLGGEAASARCIIRCGAGVDRMGEWIKVMATGGFT